MAKGSVRKKGKKWYYRFYVEDASGNLVQKECVGSESKAETEKMLRKAMEDYESKKFVARTENITLGKLLDVWAEEELKTGALSNGTVSTYLGVIGQIKKYPIGDRKLRTVTSEHLQQFMDLLCFGGKKYDGTEFNGYSKDYVHTFSAILQSAFRFAVFPKKYITFNPMQYVVFHKQTNQVDLFVEEADKSGTQPITHEEYKLLMDYLAKKSPDAILPIQISYYTGLRIGEACGLSWSDINLEEQYLTVRRSLRYSSTRHRHEIGPTKRKKVRIVDFGNTLADILRKAKKEQHRNRFEYGEFYKNVYYQEVKEKNRIYYDVYVLGRNETPPEDYKQIDLVCIRKDGDMERPSTIEIACRTARKKVDGLEGFHFHALRHTYTSNLLSNGATPKDVQELLGHSDVSTTMNVYAHATREATRNSAMILDKVAGNN